MFSIWCYSCNLHRCGFTQQSANFVVLVASLTASPVATAGRKKKAKCSVVVCSVCCELELHAQLEQLVHVPVQVSSLGSWGVTQAGTELRTDVTCTWLARWEKNKIVDAVCLHW